MFMKRFPVILLAFLLVLSLCAVCAAEAVAAEAVNSWFDSWENLFFRTRNTTLAGTATFSLDGNWFMTANGLYRQDGMNSFWKLDLSTPRVNSEIRETGFTVIANNGSLFVMEPYTPGVYRSGSDAPQSTILRDTVQIRQMTALARTLSVPLAAAMEKNLTVSEDELRLTLSEGETPALLNTALNLFAEFAVRRFFFVDYDYVEAELTDDSGSYITPSAEILYSTRDIVLRSADISMTRKDGKPQSAQATLCFVITYTSGETHDLDITFEGSVTDYGTTRVDTFDPDDFGVVPADGYVPEEDMIGNSSVDPETADFLAARGEAMMKLACSDVFPLLRQPVTHYHDLGLYNLDFGEDEPIINMEFNEDDVLIAYTRLDLLGATGEGIYSDFPITEEELSQVQEKLLAFVREVNPELAEHITKFKVEWYLAEDDYVYLQLVEDPLPDDHAYITFVVRVGPEWQILHYSSYSNG